MNLKTEVLNSIQTVIGQGNKNVPLHEPTFDESDLKAVNNCVTSTFVSSIGAEISKFENMIAEFTGVKYVVAVSNGTVALQIALSEVGVTKDTEVIVPALSFVATGNAVKHVAADPIFLDSDEANLGLDPNKLRDFLIRNSKISNGVTVNKLSGKRISAIVSMHTLGHPSSIKEIVSIGNEFQINVVEDMAESLGSKFGGIHTGNFGLTSALSFNGNKIITTGGGGAVLTNDEAIATHARHVISTAKIPHKWDFFHDELGWNYRMPNLNASLGVSQMEKLPKLVSDKRSLAKKYESAFEKIGSLKFVKEQNGVESNYWLNAIKLNKPDLETRNEILEFLFDNGIFARPLWNLMTDFPYFKNNYADDLSTAKRLVTSTICLPSSAHLNALI